MPISALNGLTTLAGSSDPITGWLPDTAKFLSDVGQQFAAVDTHIARQVQNPDTSQRLGGVLALVLQFIPPDPH